MDSMGSNGWSNHNALTSIAASGSPQELRSRRAACQRKLLEELDSLPIGEWMSRVNAMHDSIASAAARICEAQMLEAGHGPPPCAYSFIVFGSSGRRESTLWSDQDNGLIIDGEPDGSKNRYFEIFGTLLSDILETAGYEKCEGKVMCSEPMWRKTITEWEEQLRTWRSRLEWEPVRYLIIASDMRHAAGSSELSERWRTAFHAGFEGNPELHTAVLRNTVRHKAALNLLGRVMTERFGDHAGEFDVKYGMYIPLVNSIRQQALLRGIRETSTLKRLDELERKGAGVPEGLRRAFLTSLQLRAHTPYTETDGLLTSSDYVSENDLKNKQLMSELRESLLLVRKIHRALQRQLRSAERRQS